MKKSLLFFALVLASYGTIQAQVTTSSMSGVVTQSTGHATAGATIKATHTPSGTVYSGSANVAGRFSLPNMRVGGPYRIEVSYVGQSPLIYEDVYLQLGQPFVLNPVFGDNATALDEVTVTALKKAQSLKTGAETFVSRKQIENLPTVSRGIQDFTRLTPQADLKGTSLSIGGSNNRFNQFTVDGAVSNDVFGLNASGMNGGGTKTNPVSLDAIDQITVQIAPFDVRASGFAGGGISAVTRSGTNNVEGSVYYYTRNQNLTGKTPKALVSGSEQRSRLEDFTEKQYGVRLGGPIIKDKLFFFANYERTESNTPLNYPIGSSSSNLTVEEADKIYSIATGTYSYEPGSYSDLANTNESNKIFGRLDWNVNAQHKFSIRYGYTKANDASNFRNENSVTFANGGTLKDYKNHTLTAELNSRFNNSWSNNLVVGYNSVRDFRSFNGDLFPRVAIRTSNGTYNLGTDAVANVNQLDQDIFTLTNNLTWYKGVHTVTFGTHNEFYKVYNGYINNSNGAYTFSDSPATDINPVTGVAYTAIENFARGKASSYAHQYSNTDDPRQGAKFSAMQLGFYVQDEYQMQDNLKITAGVRVDIPIYNDVPMENTDFNNSILAKMYDVQTNRMPKAQLMFSPRVGFNWDVNSDRSTIVRGGLGIFTSRFPLVWASGAFTQSGALLGGHSLGNGTVANVDFVADPYNQPKFNGTVSPSGNISVLDKNLKLPQIARFSAGVDQQLPWGVKGTLEFMYSKNLSSFRFTDLNLERPTGVLEGADNRVVYDVNNNNRRVLDNYTEIIYIDNVSQGYSWSTTASLAKNFDFGLNASFAYTYTESKDITSGASSQNQSNFYRVATVNGSNNARLAHSPFSTGSRLLGVVSYSKEYIKHLGTTVSLIYSGQSGPRYSYMVSGNLIGYAASNGNQFQLMYIPKEQSEITFVQNGNKTPQQQWDELNAFIESDKYLKSRRGKYAERNAARTPFSHQFDLKIAQDLFTNIGKTKNKLQLSIDIMNVGNLINGNWGKQYSGSDSFWDNSFKPVTFAGYESGTKKPTYRLNNLNNNVPYYYQDIPSRWSAQIGVRYIFN
ncbi:TonB-dependent receptor [Sphingobacterium psychroaquaticum]|uniref:TonB-dependent Receptor Plug Domain n=1 Tax=Sphingobacterium psychroaquaticum TaxID=561061 RepID=A0A1X7JLS3_9SPHI|nr:carboxypeptidase regulatory-like domain-containing protein [Sphingobacterium psychroaquaticum]SMG29170.1 TonB-dependent Receptor Plug Domain [Sphingobacterium psychroaquaticum]